MLAKVSGAYRLNYEIVLKTGEAVRPAEALTMQLVREKPMVPVPRNVLSTYVQESDGRGVIVMGKRWTKPDQKEAYDVGT
ncbi:hypothetical protein AC579_5002 [Pseudocercospora musae]|uniref:Uncharacterized protein n=1 Tax=Pseudocercospora musae TaxID=113226 RepID=A0A139IGI2_9PEZI|nr:hypothetical protein AC579_5002 [Pseudocercospora musae]